MFLNPDFRPLSVTGADVVDGIALTDIHNLNSTDAAILAASLRYSRAMPSGMPRCLLIAADPRLIRASEAEGLPTLNPELFSVADLPAFLARHT